MRLVIRIGVLALIALLILVCEAPVPTSGACWPARSTGGTGRTRCPRGGRVSVRGEPARGPRPAGRESANGEYKACRASRAARGVWDLPARSGCRGKSGHKESRANRESRASRASRESRASRGNLGREAWRGFKVYKAQSGLGHLPSLVRAIVAMGQRQRGRKSKYPGVTTFTNGTGFVSAPSCSIVTARHVVEELDSDRLMRNLIDELQERAGSPGHGVLRPQGLGPGCAAAHPIH